MKLVLETLAGILGGVVAWIVVGFAAGQILSALYGNREGSASMGGFFVIGSMGGILGFLATFWLARRQLEPAAAFGPGTFLWPLGALAVVIGLGWAASSVLVAIYRPQAWAGLEPGEKGRIEYRLQVPATVLHGRPVTEVVTLAFRATDLDAHTVVTPLTFTAASEGSGAILTGSVPIEKRPHEQFLVVKQGGEEYLVYVKIPPDMHRSTPWEDMLYLGRNPETPMAERVAITARYEPPGR